MRYKVKTVKQFKALFKLGYKSMNLSRVTWPMGEYYRRPIDLDYLEIFMKISENGQYTYHIDLSYHDIIRIENEILD